MGVSGYYLFSVFIENVSVHTCVFTLLFNGGLLYHQYFFFQVVRLDFQHNELKQVPKCLLMLQNLENLNLSHNNLQELPNVTEWSTSLSFLDLSHNSLRNFPSAVEAPSIVSLNISHNRFQSVPKSICSFSTLQTLDLSDNQDILALPADMGHLSQLLTLHLRNLKDLHDPPKAVQGNARHCISYLRVKLRSAKSFYRMKLMLVGCAERGKSTLVARLQGRQCGDDRTVGVDVSEWEYGPVFKTKFQFSIWDFGGQKEYYATHQCFLSHRSLYILVFNLTHDERGVQELKPWLNNIALRAPQSCVVIVGTHLDEIVGRHRGEYVERVLHKVRSLVQGYTKQLVISAVVAVGLKNRLENVAQLKEAIYTSAATYRYKKELVMGQLIPASYHELDRQLRIIQQEVRREKRQPIMHHQEFRSMVYQMQLDIQDDEELGTATVFLHDVGTLLHYDDRCHNLHELYFIDPHWLCKMMAKVVAPEEQTRVKIENGILQRDKIHNLFKSTDFPLHLFQQYLTLLYRFEIALPLDNERVLITSMLDEKRPRDVDVDEGKIPPFYTRYIIFDSAKTPPGFWSRLLSRIMHSVSKASTALHLNTLPGNLIESISLSIGVTKHTRKHTSPSPLRYWNEGLCYSDQDVAFRIESLSALKYSTTEDGVLIVASPSDMGIQIIGQLVDIVTSLVQDWYPGLLDSKTNLEQRIPCYECVRMRRRLPYEFHIEECWLAIEENKSTIECGYDRNNPQINHTMFVDKIVPDLLLRDIDPRFFLNPAEIKGEEPIHTRYTEYEKVCKGMCRGSFVHIEYLSKKRALNRLRSKVQILQKCHHPCLTCMVGVVVHPKMAIVTEQAPDGSLERCLFKQQTPIHRVTLFRIAAQVAVALRFLHIKGILYRDLKASNVLLWTLHPDSLCHCKLANSDIATQFFPTGAKGLLGTKGFTGAKGLLGTKGFTAPEILHMGRNKQPAQYNEKADIFSFGMLLYQMITRKHPYYNIKPNKIDATLQRGQRPKLPEESCATTAFHYLNQLMEICWEGNPQDRPSAEDLVKYLCLSSTQSVMSVMYTRDDCIMRQAYKIKMQPYGNNEIWVCSEGNGGLEIDIYALSTLKKIRSHSIRRHIFSSICLCKDYIWIATRDGISYGALSIFDPGTRKQVYRIPQWDYMVSCITCSNTCVYIGTIDGHCFSFPIDLKKVQENPKPLRRELPVDAAITDILYIAHAGSECVWVSHTRYIYFLKPDSLAIERHLYIGHSDNFVGQLSLSPSDSSTVWSAHIGGTMLSAWDVSSRAMMFNINAAEYMNGISQIAEDGRRIITAMTPALDTVWVGMASGHVLVFSGRDLLTWYRPYTTYVQFITTIPGTGPCKKEECMILTGGQKLNSLIPDDLQKCTCTSKKASNSGAAMILWEAFNKKMTKQIKFIEENSPKMFDNHKSLRDTLHKEYLEFRDGTHLLSEETLNIQLHNQQNDIVPLEVTCPKPIKFAVLLSKIQKKIIVPGVACRIEYRDSVSGECIEIKTQDEMDNYVKFENRPQLLCHLVPIEH